MAGTGLPDRVSALARRQDGVVTTAQLGAHGCGDAVVRRLVRGGGLLRLRRGAYLVVTGRDAGGRPDTQAVRDRRVQARAASLVVPGSVIVGGTAAALWGIEGPADGAVEVAAPPGRGLRSRPDLRPHAWRLSPADITRLEGIPLTTPARTLLDVVPAAGRSEALASLDSALRRRLVSAGGLLEVRARAFGRRGSRHVDDLWALADGRAESVLESRVRLRCLDAGMPPDVLQPEILDEDGRLLARADLGYVRRSRPGRSMLLVEADGVTVHARPDAVYSDRARANRLTASGYDIVRFTWRDTLDPMLIPRVLRAAL